MDKMEQKKIDRINELGRLMKMRALTDEEKAEQKQLREEYLAYVRRSLWGTDHPKKTEKKG